MDPFERWKLSQRHKPALALLLLQALLLAALLACLGLNRFQVELTLLGPQVITLEQGEAYEEQGATALFFGSLLMKEGKVLPISISGSVNSEQVGSYTLSYQAQYRNWTDSVTRTVNVIDVTPPQIQLYSREGTYVVPGGEYFEEGYTAYDLCDGDLSERVVRTQKGNVITYYVEDNAGNSAQVQRELVYYDPVPPELTLKGESAVVLTAGDGYSEPGYTAWDAWDGDLTEQVEISGSVDPDKAGTYQLTYSVTDSYDNTVTASRTVLVKEKEKPKTQPQPQPNTVTPSGKVIYLTFDDGPGKYTRELLAVLAKYNVKATFFVVNTKYIDIVKEIVDQGHAVGIHSVTHDYSSIYASEEAYFDDLYTMQGIIKEKTGVETYLMRFPGGSSNRVSSFNPGIMSRLVRAVVEKGFRYFDWNVSSGDAGETKKTEKVVENVLTGVQKLKVSIVLQHDIKGYSVAAVEEIIIWGLENGYTFLPLDMTSPTAQHGVNN